MACGRDRARLGGALALHARAGLVCPVSERPRGCPSAGRVAWVMNAKGVRNVWVAEAPDYKGRAVTAFTEDDGEEIGDLAFTADGSAVVFVRGGAPNRAGEIPNPREPCRFPRASRPPGADRRRRAAPGGWALAAAPPEGAPHRLRGEEPGLEPGSGGGRRRRAALRRSRRSRLAAFLAGRIAAFVRERPRRPRLRGRLRPRGQDRPLARPRRRS